MKRGTRQKIAARTRKRKVVVPQSCVVTSSVNSDLRRFHKELKEQGKGVGFLETLRKLSDRLTKNPRGFGEALYRLPGLRCMVYQGIIGRLVVTHAVHEQLPLVFVHVVKLLSGPGS